MGAELRKTFDHQVAVAHSGLSWGTLLGLQAKAPSPAACNDPEATVWGLLPRRQGGGGSLCVQVMLFCGMARVFVSELRGPAAA